MQENKKNTCAYCGDAFVNHTFVYIGNTIASFMDPYLCWSARHTPRFIKNFVDFILKIIFYLIVLLHLGKFSSDIEKSASLRSKVIWEEAIKRNINVEQLIILGKPTEQYRFKSNKKYFFYESLPIPPKLSDKTGLDWDNKFVLKKSFLKDGIPVPQYGKIPFFLNNKVSKLFEKFNKPIIVKPISGSRGRHTTTNIFTFNEFNSAIVTGRMISPSLVAEEHLFGYVCRATLVNGKLAGFYRAESPSIVGDGIKTVAELIKEKDENRLERVSSVPMSKEIEEYVLRLGYAMNSVLPKDQKIFLTHRTGRYFGGKTKEMLDELHPSFVPILEKAAKITKLPIIGFDCIILNPEEDEKKQRWGIIECNTLPFIDLHYFALEGKNKNIAGMIWDLWDL
ncbi:MAG: hypothetical protein KBD52_00535 [Candidatus Pacebacteria bacterium]|nr:hypothetical protein [Candidatus Paceibacterota bacterium]